LDLYIFHLLIYALGRLLILAITHIYSAWHIADGLSMSTIHISNVVHALNVSLNRPEYYL